MKFEAERLLQELVENEPLMRFRGGTRRLTLAGIGARRFLLAGCRFRRQLQ